MSIGSVAMVSVSNNFFKLTDGGDSSFIPENDMQNQLAVTKLTKHLLHITRSKVNFQFKMGKNHHWIQNSHSFIFTQHVTVTHLELYKQKHSLHSVVYQVSLPESGAVVGIKLFAFLWPRGSPAHTGYSSRMSTIESRHPHPVVGRVEEMHSMIWDKSYGC